MNMDTALLPLGVQQVTFFLFFALGIFLVGAYTALATLAAARAPLAARTRARVPFAVAGFLAGWLGLAVVVGAALQHRTAADARLIGLLVGVGPMLVALALAFRTRTIAALDEAMAPDWLIRLQTYRMGGLVFLFPFLYYGLLPAGFAVPAALGDFATGLLAPFVAAKVARRDPHAMTWAVAWNAFGILDLLVAPASAVLSGAPALTLYPLSLVPLFIGPPLGILTHVLSLRNLARAERGVGVRVVSPAA
jgi:hypothetical protein